MWQPIPLEWQTENNPYPASFKYPINSWRMYLFSFLSDHLSLLFPLRVLLQHMKGCKLHSVSAFISPKLFCPQSSLPLRLPCFIACESPLWQTTLTQKHYHSWLGVQWQPFPISSYREWCCSEFSNWGTRSLKNLCCQSEPTPFQWKPLSLTSPKQKNQQQWEGVHSIDTSKLILPHLQIENSHPVTTQKYPSFSLEVLAVPWKT